MAKKISKFRANTAIRTDERVRLMNEIITAIKVIKMYTWEKPFIKLVAAARKMEIREIRGASYLRGIIMSFAMFSTRFSTFVSILTFVLMGSDPNAYYVFVITSFYNSLRQVMTNQLPQGMALFAELSISISRIQNLLEYEEIDYEMREIKINSYSNPNEEAAICIKNAAAKWDLSLPGYSLSNINLKIYKGQLLAVIGSVGSGKSSLLQAILRELPLTEGTIETKGKISYAAQEPWLFTGSIRQNILFGQPLNEERYNQVVKVCALERDFSRFPFGDKSIVGERGVLLSGGQKARISLARAAYKEADIYLLDDPLSAVDTHVGKQLFEDCIRGFLKQMCVILVTHQLQFLTNVDNVMVLENGRVMAEGSYRELQQGGYLGKLSENREKRDKEEREEKEVVGSEVTQATSSNKDLMKRPIEIKEHKSIGKVTGRIYMAYVKAGGGKCLAISSLLCFLLAQVTANGSDYFTTFWLVLNSSSFIILNIY